MTADVIFAGTRYSGSDMEENAARLAGRLAELGIGEADVVAVLMRNCYEYAEIIRGCRTAGCFYCPINWHFKQAEVSHILRDSGAKLLLIHADLLPAIEAGLPDDLPVIAVDPGDGSAQRCGLPDYASWRSAKPPYQGPPRRPRGHMPYTSGTTGRPKGVRRTSAPAEHPPSHPLRRMLVPAPLYHSAPSSFAQQALQFGELLVLMLRFDPEQLLALIEEHRIESVYIVPIMYVRLLRLPEKVRRRYDLSSLRYVISTGSPCPTQIKRAMLDWWGDVIYELYGSSETGMITLQDPASARSRPGSVGHALPHAEIRVFDDEGKECPPGQIGAIYVRGSTDFTYQNNDDARSAIDRDGLVTLGDLGYLDDDGYLYICDRKSDMVISGGVNIYPAEIENVLLTLPGVSDCAVIGIPDDEYGESLLALVETVPTASPDADALRTALSERLANFKVPRRIEFVDSLPRDDNGKIVKRRLRDRYWQGRHSRV